MNRSIVGFLCIVMIGIGALLRFSTSHEQMPVGCDEFGYLNQAKAMDKGITFSAHAKRPYIEKLLDTLRKEGITENEIAWMITPHAYHLIPGTDKIINQYPPGTSFILHLVPFEYRKILFPLLTMFLLLLLPLFAIMKINGSGISWFHPVFALFIYLVTVSAPFLTELTRVNSLAFTFGMLIAAGILLRSNPLWSCFLIVLTINFRVANLIMVLPVFMFLQPNFKQLFTLKNIATFGFIAIVALMPLLYYNYQVIGNALSSTYSSIDKSFTNAEGLSKLAEYYFNLNQYWFRVHLIAIACLIIFSLLKKLNFRFFICVLLFPGFNYLFFIFHEVKMDYYPYASAMILIGVVLGILAEYKIPSKYFRPALAFVLGLSLFILAGGVSRYIKRTHTNFIDAQNKYSALCEFDIVWADLYSGTSEYVCDNNGFRYGTTTPRARKLAMLFLHHNNFRQIILLDDNTVDAEQIISEVKQTELNYKAVNDVTVGNFIVIE